MNPSQPIHVNPRRALAVVALCIGALSLVGVVMLYSTAFKATNEARFHDQFKWFGIALILAPLLVWTDYGRFQKRLVLYVLAILTVLLLIAALIPGVGVHVNGANRWVRGLGQPSEFAKPVVVLLLAAWLAQLAEGDSKDLKRGFLIPLLIGSVPGTLIFIEPDWGTAVLVISTAFILAFVAGARWSYLITAGVSSVFVFSLLLLHNPIRLQRIMVFLDPEAHRHESGWQIWHSLLAIGSGGMWGRFLDGSLHKYGYVPEQQTDLIFARIGEEMGLWGTSLVVLLFVGILLAGMKIARAAREPFGYYVALGCTTVMALQGFINIAVAVSLIPNKGLPLPFVSYGGSNLIAMFICAGLLGSVAWHSKPPKQMLSARQLTLF